MHRLHSANFFETIPGISRSDVLKRFPFFILFRNVLFDRFDAYYDLVDFDAFFISRI